MRALDEGDAGQAVEADHPDSQADDPENGEERRQCDGATESARATAVARNEDRLVMRLHAKSWFFQCRHFLVSN
jgi:hypothetical protein